MPSRTLTMIRRGINRLNDLVKQHPEIPALRVIGAAVASCADNVNAALQRFQNAAIDGDRERAERDTAMGELLTWVQSWRPVILMLVPGADKNIRNLPYDAPTPDDLARVAEDMLTVMKENQETADILQPATADLGDKIEKARKETAEANMALPAETVARAEYSEACLNANNILVRGSEIVRTVFGRTSPEYKQFIERSKGNEEEEEEAEAQTGDA
ncbi:MAG: hypothetical protein JXA71_10670 [Chitinispirillaceae bacterium]|nr:hypothetical protein [Chitinispirillaceae bacterium]